MSDPNAALAGEWTYSEYARLSDDVNRYEVLDGEVLVTPAPTRTIDRVKKPRRYLDFGVPAYWVVDPAEGVVWTWTAQTGPDDPAAERETVRWRYPDADASFELDVGPLVAPF